MDEKKPSLLDVVNAEEAVREQRSEEQLTRKREEDVLRTIKHTDSLQVAESERNKTRYKETSAYQTKLLDQGRVTTDSVKAVGFAVTDSMKKLLTYLKEREHKELIESLRNRYNKAPVGTAEQTSVPSAQQKDAANNGGSSSGGFDFDFPDLKRKRKYRPFGRAGGASRAGNLLGGASKAAEAMSVGSKAGVAGEIASGAAKTGGLLGGAAKVGGGVLRTIGTKIPLIGAAITAGLAISDTADKSEEQIQKEGGRSAALGCSAVDALTFGYGTKAIDAAANSDVGKAVSAAVSGVVDSVPGMRQGVDIMKKVADTQASLIMAPFSEGARRELSKTFDDGLKNTREVFSTVGESFTTGFASLSSTLTGLGDTIKTEGSSFIGSAASWVGDKAEAVRNWGSKGTGVVSRAAELVGGGVADAASRVSLSVGKGAAAERRANIVNEMKSQGVTDPKQQAMILAQLDHESGGFKSNQESFNYRSADRIMEVRGSARKKGRAAVEAAMQQGPEAVAELMYGGDKSLGNTQAGDGYKFRGRGDAQLTGRANYARAGKELGLDLENNPDLLLDSKVSAKVSMWYMKDRKGLMQSAAKGDVLGATKKFNGGTNGFQDRQAKYNSYLAEIQNGGIDKFATAKPSDVKVAEASPKKKADTAPVATAAKSPVTVTQSADRLADKTQSPASDTVKVAMAPPVTPVAPAAPRETAVVKVANQPDLSSLVQQQQAAPARSDGSGGGHMPSLDDMPTFIHEYGLMSLNMVV